MSWGGQSSVTRSGIPDPPKPQIIATKTTNWALFDHLKRACLNCDTPSPKQFFLCPLHKSGASRAIALNVGMPTWHPHPKNPSWPLPFPSVFVLFLFGRLCLRGFAAPCLLLHAHVKLQSETWGAWSMRPRPLYHHHYNHLFGVWARDGNTR